MAGSTHAPMTGTTQTATSTTTTTNPFSTLDLSIPTLVDILLLLAIPLLFLLARLRTALTPTEPPLAQYLLPWRTKSWAALYGLLRLSYDDDWPADKNAWIMARSLHGVWHEADRPWLGRLLAMGIIPLRIRDGGMRTEADQEWGFSWNGWCPRVRLPMYTQTKRRAMFEFIVVKPDEDAARARFVSDLVTRVVDESVGRDEKIGVTIREAPPHPGRIRYSWYNRPAPEERAMQVGARSAVVGLLPFLRDEVIEKGYGERANSLSVFVQGNDPQTIPLLGLSRTQIVRVEANHYGACELDSFVFGMAQEAGMKALWPVRTCREAALEEMRECGLPTEGLKSSSSSLLEKCR